MMRVLVVYSWDDDISQRRYKHMRAALRGAHFRFEQCFALPSPDDETRSETITAMVSRAIDQLRPDVLLIHSGAAYQRGPEQYAEAVLTIHTKYPDLRFGLERRFAEPPLRNLGVFEVSGEMQAIEDAVFR